MQPHLKRVDDFPAAYRKVSASRLSDQRGLVVGANALIDVLQSMEQSRRRYGLGIIAGDDPARVTLEVRVERMEKPHVGTLLTVTHLEAA